MRIENVTRRALLRLGSLIEAPTSCSFCKREGVLCFLVAVPSHPRMFAACFACLERYPEATPVQPSQSNGERTL